MYIVSKSEQASLNFEQKYHADSSFRDFLKKGFEHQGIDVSGEPDQVRIYERNDQVLGYIVIYGGKGCFVVTKDHLGGFQKAIAWYLKNPKKLCYRYTDENGFESRKDMNQIFEDPRFKAIKDEAKAIISH